MGNDFHSGVSRIIHFLPPKHLILDFKRFRYVLIPGKLLYQAGSENLNLIISESNRMSEMVTDILDYSQFSAGYNKLKKDWYDLKDIVNAELTRCRQRHAAFGNLLP